MIFSWSVALAFIILGGSLYSSFFLLFILIYMAIPGFVALHFYALEKMRVPIKFAWNKELLPAITLPVLLGYFVVLISLPFSQMRSIDHLHAILPSFLAGFTPFTMILLFVLFGTLVAVVGGGSLYFLISVGPELLWRGYMWDKLKGFGFWKTSVLMGIFWGLWQAPLVLIGYSYPEHPFFGVLFVTIYSICVSPWLLYFRLQSQSVVAPALFSSILSALSAISVFLFTAPNYLYIGIGGVTGFIACILFNLLLFVKLKKNPLFEFEL